MATDRSGGPWREITTPPFAAVTFIEWLDGMRDSDDGFTPGENLSRGNVIAAPSLAELRNGCLQSSGAPPTSSNELTSHPPQPVILSHLRFV